MADPEEAFARVPPSPPAAAVAVCEARLPLMVRFAGLLAGTGVDHGLIGPREVPRLWDRHLLNCAVIEDAFPAGARVLDIGSGAGLPGLAVAIVRPDLEMVLVEPMLRRTTWLEAAVAELGLDNVTVVRGRAEDLKGTLIAPWATARAVAALDRLARWTFPLLRPGGTLVAMKGATAGQELETHTKALRRAGMVSAVVTPHGEAVLDRPSLTVDLVRR
ncbi:Ribosomal RNA small subunit methyltransferase G [Nostocoides japonicum T1-X7]|uniref:Ribosomal RNA small subunit methyltransferase G n=1 Tax=Nostocoides japonicum T1-X7 TaxID=1194083 RepID=A0A077M827_9MICO|nr:16S rRNA (guanine(527)-N(7))-methyltransferase RsmG [Tetrasphaera japonica]CCH80165.1 Ribosomal RNA small subunit methyltransferase G [Tetrasphaera japonica T1-X7]